MNRHLSLLCALSTVGLFSAAQTPVPATAPPPIGVQPMKALARIRTPELLQQLNKKVTIEGYFYDGSIPMLVDDFEKIRINSLLTPDSYIPLVGHKLKLKWGDRVKVTGILESGKPPLEHEQAVLRVKASSKVEMIQATSVH